MPRLFALAALLTLSSFVALVGEAEAGGRAGKAAAPAEEVKAKTGLVFIANTGLEDVQTLAASLKHAKAAMESGQVDEVHWIVYGRATAILDPDLKTIPESLKADVEAARAAGVRLVACGNAIERNGLDRARLAFPIEVVDTGIGEVARLSALGYGLLRY
ncbi:MAG: DsrE family protein [Deltaproteobacteria bacterium]|nr:DsrE family protein [Deltaproteobacteria bacterium]